MPTATPHAAPAAPTGLLRAPEVPTFNPADDSRTSHCPACHRPVHASDTAQAAHWLREHAALALAG
jgi:hypothetical protein